MALDSKITTYELQYTIKNLKIKSSPGKNLIYNEITFNLPPNLLDKLKDTFNSILEQRVIPKQWTEYNTILIPKPENKGYRPIALASSLLKLLEKIIKMRLDWYVEKDHLLPNSQIGFRKQKSTQDSTTLLATDAYLTLLKKQIYAILMVDIEDAFDNVDPKILVKDLIDLKIWNKIVNVAFE